MLQVTIEMIINDNLDLTMIEVEFLDEILEMLF